MMSALRYHWSRLDPKARWALLSALLLFVLLEIWLLGLRGPWQQWRKAQAERHRQAQMLGPDLSAELAEARQALATLQAQSLALKTAHQAERLYAWREPLQRAAEQHHVTLETLTAQSGGDGLPRISLVMKGRYADVLAVQHSLSSLDLPLWPQSWTAQVQTDGKLSVRLEAVPSAETPSDSSPPQRPLQDPFGSTRTADPHPDGGSQPPLKLRALVAAGSRSMVLVDDQVLELGGVIQGYRLIEVREDRALFVKQGRVVTAMLDTPASP